MELLASRTPKGDDIYIVTDNLGMYRIERRGPGPKMALENQRFTQLALAKRALQNYERAHEKEFLKELRKSELVDMHNAREHAKTLKNGELDSTVNGD